MRKILSALLIVTMLTTYGCATTTTYTRPQLNPNDITLSNEQLTHCYNSTNLALNTPQGLASLSTDEERSRWEAKRNECEWNAKVAAAQQTTVTTTTPDPTGAAIAAGVGAAILIGIGAALTGPTYTYYPRYYRCNRFGCW